MALNSRRHDLEFQSADSETVFIKLYLAAIKKIIVGVIYRHPTNTFNEFQDLFLQTLNKMDHEKYDYFLCGDFNINILKHESKKNIGNYLKALYSEGCNNVINQSVYRNLVQRCLITCIPTQLTA